ncbi:hypothetical protein ACNFIA_18230 [Pseudomonas sp. NY15437]|uniref:hypothetical protein n=1 Tax=Pseudomonas sp. NY15437 TaxID=3400360 RepID=UPI003A87A060
MSNQPSAAKTIAGAQQEGTLRPINRVKLRAQLGMVDEVTAASIRRAISFVIERVLDYYQVVAYTGPGYVFGRVDSDFPSALYAAPHHNYMYDRWDHREMSPTHPTCSNEKLINEAGWLCLDTACRVAVFELALEVPEAKKVLEHARSAVMSMCEDRTISEVNWRESRRRLGTPGVRKILRRMLAKLPAVDIGRGSIRPVILAPGALRSGLNHVTDWSNGSTPLAAAV